MKPNVGKTDRTIRILIGVALLAASLVDAIGAWGWIGIIPLLTGMLGFCPVYALFGLRTCKQHL